MKYSKRIVATALCAAIASSVSAGAVMLPCNMGTTPMLMLGTTNCNFLQGNVQQVIEKLCGDTLNNCGDAQSCENTLNSCSDAQSCEVSVGEMPIVTSEATPKKNTENQLDEKQDAIPKQTEKSIPQETSDEGTEEVVSETPSQTTQEVSGEGTQKNTNGTETIKENLSKDQNTSGDSQEAPVITSNEDVDTTESENTTQSGYAQQVVQLVNAERQKQGLTALKIDTTVQKAAQVRATEQAQSFSHTRPNGTSCFTALTEQGITYRSAGENIAYGQSTPQEVMNAWMNSEGHRANILSEKFTTIGVGYTVINGQSYWAQMFIS